MSKERTRKEIRAEYEANKSEIKRLEDRNIELLKESLVLSDDERQYKEEDGYLIEWQRPEGAKRSKRVKAPHRIGKIYWKETFFDQDTTPPTPIEIERSRIVKVNGEWYNDGRGHTI